MILLLILGAGAYYDAREHRIPNWWIVLSASVGVALVMLESGRPVGMEVLIQEGGWFLLRMLSVMILFFPLFLCRMIGAGDIKLSSLVCGLLGYGAGAAVLGFGFAVGAVWSFFKMLSQGSFRYRFTYLIAYFRRIYHTRQITAYYNTSTDRDEGVIPLGVCLFFGAMLYHFLII